MPLSRNLALYSDIEAVLRKAREAGGAIYTPSQSAVRWQQRAYMYRKLLAEAIQEKLPPGQLARTEYDNMSLRLNPDRTKITIRFQSMDDLGTLEPLPGAPNKLDQILKPTSPPVDELFEDIAALVAEEGAEE